jgi:hypothetical protein
MATAKPADEGPLLKAALWYASRGFPVFPVHGIRDRKCTCSKADCSHPGKHPRTRNGFKDATTDQSKIKDLWEEWPDANIGLPTGPSSGLLAIDIDPRNGGDSSWDSLVQNHGLPPPTAEQKTGGGGRHILFRDPAVKVPKELAPGIDVKSAGGYIIVAPSVHASGQLYVWDGSGPEVLLNVADAPPWLLTRLAAALRRKPAMPAANVRKFSSGQRNNRLTSLAGKMRRNGASREGIEAALLEENQGECDPPLLEAEVRKIAESVARYAPSDDLRMDSQRIWSNVISFTTAEPDSVPADCLPGWLGEMVVATANNTETPVELGALIGISVVASCIAGKAVISPEPGYSEPLNVYTCPTMEPGNRKSAVFTTLLEPMMDYERDRIAREAPERKRLESEKRTTEARIAYLRTKAAKSTDPRAARTEIRELEETLPIVPPIYRVHVDDCTPEGLASLMAEQGGRIAVFSDEGGIFELIAGRYSKGAPNLDLWLKGHSVSPMRVDRADPHRAPILLDRPHLTVGISPQPDVLESLRDKPGFRGRGLLARFLYALPQSPLGYRTLEPCPIPGDLTQRYRTCLRKLLELKLQEVMRLKLSGAAYSEWKEFQRAIEIQFRDGGKLEGLKDWGSKLPGAALRIAGIFHFVAQIEHDSISLEVTLDTMRRAVELATCLISHARAVFALMERDPNIEDAQKLIVWIGRWGRESFTIRDCFRAHQSRFNRVDAMTPALNLLEQHGYIRQKKLEPTCGRPSDIYEVNPEILGGTPE